MSTYGIAGAFNITPVFSEPSRNLVFPSSNKLVTILDRYLPRIREKSGIATFTVFDGKTGNREYRTINFFAQGVAIGRSESVSIVKTNRGFTLYSPDANPTTLTLTGTLLNGNDWSAGGFLGLFSDPSKITHTDWVVKFLSDYDHRLSSTAAIRNNQVIYFSFENFFAEVHVVSIGTAVSGDDPLVSPLRVSMVAKELRVTFRPDIPGFGPDAVPVADKKTADLSAAGESAPKQIAPPLNAPEAFNKGGVGNFTPNVFYNASSPAIAQAARTENLNAFLAMYQNPEFN
jgi:hypothetical protein